MNRWKTLVRITIYFAKYIFQHMSLEIHEFLILSKFKKNLYGKVDYQRIQYWNRISRYGIKLTIYVHINTCII